MEDEEIIQLFMARDERALRAVMEKYGDHCFAVAMHILRNKEDSEECVNDAYMALWHQIPPKHPQNLGAYVEVIAHNLALKRFRWETQKKRGGKHDTIPFHTLEKSLALEGDAERVLLMKHRAEIFEVYLRELSPKNRMVVVQYYWYMRTIKEIAILNKMSESGVKMILSRAKKRLKQLVKEEDFL